MSFALTGPIAAGIGVEATFVAGGIIAATATALFLFVPGVRDTEREGALALGRSAPTKR